MRVYWIVGRNDGTVERRQFPTHDEAAAYIGSLPDVGRVQAGDYYLDGPCVDQMEDFISGYIDCALWSSMGDDGEPFDKTYGREDIAPDALASMAEDCQHFAADHAADLAQAGQDAQNGHDFWLTRNGHGAGFWDRGYGDAGRRLTDAAHDYGTSDLYVGDDGKLYVS